MEISGTPLVVPLPAGASLSFTLDDAAALRVIGDLASRFRHPRPLLTLIASLLRQGFRDQFEQGGDPAWLALAPSTVRRKQNLGVPARNPSGRIPTRLKQNGAFAASNVRIRSGRDRDSWGRKDSPDHIETINEATGEVIEGSSVEYDRYQQQGVAARQIGASRSLVNFTAAGFRAKGIADGKRLSARGGGLPARPVTITDATTGAIVSAARQYFAGNDASGGEEP